MTNPTLIYPSLTNQPTLTNQSYQIWTNSDQLNHNQLSTNQPWPTIPNQPWPTNPDQPTLIDPDRPWPNNHDQPNPNQSPNFDQVTQTNPDQPLPTYHDQPNLDLPNPSKLTNSDQSILNN